MVGLAEQVARMDAAPPPADIGLGLSDYRVTIEGRTIDGLADNTSGLTFSAAAGTLFAAINRPPALAELTTDGRLVRLIAVTGGTDLEGITHVEDDRFIVVDEGRGRASWITVTAQTETVDLGAAPFVDIGLSGLSNLGLEGLSWDQRRKELVLTQEMLPVRVLVAGGLDRAVSDRGLALREWQPDSWAGHGVADLSSVTVHDRTGNMVLLSHMSSVLIEYAADGRPLSLLSLWAGRHGLRAAVPQAEGVAIGPDGAVYIVSEPNLFYRFAPDAAETGRARP